MVGGQPFESEWRCRAIKLKQDRPREKVENAMGSAERRPATAYSAASRERLSRCSVAGASSARRADLEWETRVFDVEWCCSNQLQQLLPVAPVIAGWWSVAELPHQTAGSGARGCSETEARAVLGS